MFENSKDIFIVGPFFRPQKSMYKIIIIKANLKNTNNYYTTCFALHKNKKETLYNFLFSEINKNLNYINKKIFKPLNVIIDFEQALSNAIISIWNNCNIKYCFFHYQQIL